MSAALSTAAWVAHDLGTAIGVGGSLFGRIALEPAMRKISDREERGLVVMNAWRRFGVVQISGLAIMAATWFAGRMKLGGLAVGDSGTEGLIVAKDVLVGTTLASAVGAAVAGNLMAKQRGDEAVPLNDEGEAESPPRAKALGKVTDAFGIVNLLAGAGVIALTAILAMKAGKSARWSLVSRLLP